MEQHGLLRREPVPQDGRLKRLVLTDKALALDARIKRSSRDTETLMRAGISEEDMDAWFRVRQDPRESEKLSTQGFGGTRMIKRLLQSVREFKKDALLTPFLWCSRL